MKHQEAQQQWWTALKGWMDSDQGRADYLFVYDPKLGRLERCFEKDAPTEQVDEATVSMLYQAAEEGRLGLLRPEDLKPQLITADPEQEMLVIKVLEEEERRERERKEREELLAAQNLVIWAAASEKRDQEAFEARMEHLEMLEQKWEKQDREWKEYISDVAQELNDMDLSGASEDECKEKIRSYLNGEKPRSHTAQRKEGEEPFTVSAEMWGNTLRHFCRFAASEVPLSVRHVQVAEHCRKIIRQLREQGCGLDDLGLDPQEQIVLRGTIEMGTLVEHGLRAERMLTSGGELSVREYRECLRNYLAMKGVEETLIPHVQNYEKEIRTGDGPVSALQVLMAHQGFRANDLRAKAGRTDSMARLGKMGRDQVARMIRRGDSELGTMGRQVMIASCQMDLPAAPVVSEGPKAPRKNGPVR